MPEAPNESKQDDERYEAYIQCFTHAEPDLRRFIRSLLPTWSDTDEVLQQTALVAWRKFDDFDRSTQFIKWTCVIARFEALAYRRKMARDRLVFREDVFELMASEGIDEIEERSAEHTALEHCLAAIPPEQRKFVTLAYTPGVKIKELAAEAGSTSAAFYMRLKRIRHKLMDCIESRQSSPPTS